MLASAASFAWLLLVWVGRERVTYHTALLNHPAFLIVYVFLDFKLDYG